MITSEEYPIVSELQSQVININQSDGVLLSPQAQNISSQDAIFEEDSIDSTRYFINKSSQQKIQEDGWHDKSSDAIIDNNRIRKVEGENFWGRIINKIERFRQNSKKADNEEQNYEQEQQIYLQKMKIVYSRFLVEDSNLTLDQLEQLKSLLYVPKLGESLVNWGHQRYRYRLSILGALQKLYYVEQLKRKPKRFREELAIIIILLLLIIIIKVIS